MVGFAWRKKVRIDNGCFDRAKILSKMTISGAVYWEKEKWWLTYFFLVHRSEAMDFLNQLMMNLSFLEQRAYRDLIKFKAACCERNPSE